MIVDDRPAAYQGNLPWATLVALIQAYDPPENPEFQALAQGPEPEDEEEEPDGGEPADAGAKFALRVTRGAHDGAYYGPPYDTSYYFDLQTEDAGGVSATTHHVLLNATGTQIIGIDPPL